MKLILALIGFVIVFVIVVNSTERKPPTNA